MIFRTIPRRLSAINLAELNNASTLCINEFFGNSVVNYEITCTPASYSFATLPLNLIVSRELTYSPLSYSFTSPNIELDYSGQEIQTHPLAIHYEYVKIYIGKLKPQNAYRIKVID